MIQFPCPKCGQSISVEDSLAGQAATCPNCGNVGVAPPAPPTPPGPPPPAAADEKTIRTWAMACHLAGLACYAGVPFGNILGPLVVWLIKKDEYPEVDRQGKEAMNFQISMAIYAMVAFLLVVVIVGVLLLAALVIFHLIATITAAVRASQGKAYRYPLAIRFFK